MGPLPNPAQFAPVSCPKCPPGNTLFRVEIVAGVFRNRLPRADKADAVAIVPQSQVLRCVTCGQELDPKTINPNSRLELLEG